MAAPPLPPKSSSASWMRDSRIVGHDSQTTFSTNRTSEVISLSSTQQATTASSDGISLAPPLPPRPSVNVWNPPQIDIMTLIPPPPKTGPMYRNNQSNSFVFSPQPKNVSKTFPSSAILNIVGPPANIQPALTRPPANNFVNQRNPIYSSSSTAATFANNIYFTSSVVPCSSSGFSIHHSRSAPDLANYKPNDVSSLHRGSIPNGSLSSTSMIHSNTHSSFGYSSIRNNQDNQACLENVLKFMKKKRDSNLIDLYFSESEFLNAKFEGGKPGEIDDVLRLFDPLAEVDESVLNQQEENDNERLPKNEDIKGDEGITLVKETYTAEAVVTTSSCIKEESSKPKAPSETGKISYTSLRFNDASSDEAAILNISKNTSPFDLQIYPFVEKLKKLRSEFSHDDYPTNAGVVICPTLDHYQEDALSIQLIISSIYSEKPVSFTCDVSTSIEHIISHTVCTLFDDTSSLSMDNFILKVFGLSEYFTAHSSLADYEYVHQCHKFDKPVFLTLIDVKDLKRPFVRVKVDDNNIQDLKVDEVAPVEEKRAISFDSLGILLEIFGKEIDKIKFNASRFDGGVLCPQNVVQAVKAICTHLSLVETSDITDAVNSLIHVSLLFGKTDLSDLNTLPVFDALTSSAKGQENNKFHNLCQLLELSLQQVQQSIHKLLVIYSHTFCVDFEIPSAKKTFNAKPVTEFLDTLLFQMGIVHGLTPSALLQYEMYSVKCEICYGERVIDSVTSKSVSFSKSLFPRLVFDEWIQFESLSMCTLPREAVLYFTLWALTTSQSEGNHPAKIPLGWCGVRLFNYNEELVQGSLLLGIWSSEIPRNAGPILSNPDSCTPLLQINLPEFDCDVKFPSVIDNKFATFQKRSFGSLEPSVQKTLTEVIERDILSPLKAEEKELLWDKRNYLHKFPHALSKVLLSAHGWDWACLSDIYSLLKGWNPLSPVDSLKLLLPCFPDRRVRETAIHWMKNIVSDELCDYLPQMVQVLRYESWDDSATAWFLLERSLTSVRVAHHMYWLLKQNVADTVAGKRMQLLLNALLAIVGKAMREKIASQEALLSNLSEIAENVKTSKESLRLSILFHELEITHHNLIDSSTCLPLSPSLEICGVDVKSCSYFTSNTLPLKLQFRSLEKEAKNIEAIYKVGDDLRQDMITLQMIRIMDKLWLKEGLDLKIVTFMCVATEYRRGMVELVPEAETLRKIQTELGLTGSFKDRSIAEWLQKYNTSELEYQQAVDNFTLSCAGYCVATYILGICDRHNDNIMLKTSGHIFHIDFGKFLGDSQMFGSIKRDRTPFVLTSDMAYVINGGDKPSKNFQNFIDLCCQAFNIIRKNSVIFFNLFMLMVSSGTPGLSPSAVNYIKKALLPELSEAEAMAQFTQMIQDSLKSWFTQFNFFIHNLAQLRFTGDHNDDLLLSFIPKVFNKEGDGKITLTSVIGYKKMYDPEKYYMYIVKVERQNLPVSSCVFRTYREFVEFHQKLCVLFPLAKFNSLRGNPVMGRTNVREVAERRKEELSLFLNCLMNMAEEISHCDLVYTFFHPLLRDQEGIEDAREAKAEIRRSRRGSSLGQIYGQIKLSILYKNNSLFIMIMHAKNLSSPKGTAPDPYVKTYLLPDPHKSTKRKTKIIFKSCHPTFMEMLVYDSPLDAICYRTLHVSVWDYDRVQENEFLGAALIPLSEDDLMKESIRWYQLAGFNS